MERSLGILATDRTRSRTQSLLRLVPFSLTTLRLFLAPLTCLIALHGSAAWQPPYFALILTTGLLSDIFDGIIARRLGVATPWLRKYDSFTDLIFWVAVLGACWWLHPVVIRAHGLGLALLAGAELAEYTIALCRFGSPPAIHGYLAKLWGLGLFAATVALLVGGTGSLLPALIALGLIAQAECLVLLISARKAPVDVPGLIAGWGDAATGRRRALFLTVVVAVIVAGAQTWWLLRP